MSLFDGVFFGDRAKHTERYILEHPKKEIPDEYVDDMPSEQDLTVWEGEGILVDSFLDGELQYVVVNFDHHEHGELDVPSNHEDYIYSYDDLPESDETEEGDDNEDE